MVNEVKKKTAATTKLVAKSKEAGKTALSWKLGVSCSQKAGERQDRKAEPSSEVWALALGETSPKEKLVSKKDAAQRKLSLWYPRDWIGGPGRLGP